MFEGFHSRDFAESLYAETNNVNRLSLQPRDVTSDAALDNSHLIAMQHAYVDKVLAEAAGFGNVIYEIANETGGALWVAHLVDYVHHHPNHPGRLVSAGEQTTAFDPRTGANDIVVKHRGGAGLYASDTDVRDHREALMRFRVGKPVSHNEYFLYASRSADDVNFPRKMMWANFTAGGHCNLFDFTFWRGTGRTLSEGRTSRCPPAEIMTAGQYLLDFLAENQIKFWVMSPHDELAKIEAGDSAYVFTLAQPGGQYICYVLGKGPVTVALELTEGSFTARWYDPKSGRFVGRVQDAQGAGWCRFPSPAFRRDIVLFICRSKRP